MGILLVVGAANAAEVVDLRVGRHAKFSRVVFELDSPAGYRLERHEREGSAPELVISLDATSSEKSVTLANSLIDVVDLRILNGKAVAHIRLNQPGLSVKEMILPNPPRIVLDFLIQSKAAPKAAGVLGKSQPSASPGSAAGSTKSVEATASVKPKAPIPVVVPRRVPDLAPAPVASINSGAIPAPKRVATRSTIPAAARHAPKRALPAKRSVTPLPKVVPAKSRLPSAIRTPAKTPPPPARQKAAARPVAVPKQPRSIPAPAPKSLFTATNVGGGLALLGLVGGGTFFMLRRRSQSDELDDDVFEMDPLSVDNPFASLSGDDKSDDAEASSDNASDIPTGQILDDDDDGTTVDEFASTSQDDTSVAKEQRDQDPQEQLFETAADELTSSETEEPGAQAVEASGDDDMEAYGDTMVTGASAAPPIAGAGVADNSEIMRMLREFEQRVAGLETRLDEVMESKERLERQVAAQTEELRVQRAAIARTQRALRNLSRSEEDSPTEPALRDPNQ